MGKIKMETNILVFYAGVNVWDVIKFDTEEEADCFINKIKELDFLFCSGSRFANTPAGICSDGGKSEIYKKRQNHDTDSS